MGEENGKSVLVGRKKRSGGAKGVSEEERQGRIERRMKEM